MKTSVLMAALLAGMTATAVAADDDGRRGHGGKGMMGPMIIGSGLTMEFSTLDADGNGELTLEELQAAPAAKFAATDTNGDGALDADELKAEAMASAEARIDQGIARMIERFDENGDGKLQADEMPEPGKGRRNPAERLFKHMDADGDGVVTEEEFEAAKAKLADRGGKRGRGN